MFKKSGVYIYTSGRFFFGHVRLPMTCRWAPNMRFMTEVSRWNMIFRKKQHTLTPPQPLLTMGTQTRSPDVKRKTFESTNQLVSLPSPTTLMLVKLVMRHTSSRQVTAWRTRMIYWSKTCACRLLWEIVNVKVWKKPLFAPAQGGIMLHRASINTWAFCDRTGVPNVQWLKKSWLVDMESLPFLVYSCLNWLERFQTHQWYHHSNSLESKLYETMEQEQWQNRPFRNHMIGLAKIQENASELSNKHIGFRFFTISFSTFTTPPFRCTNKITNSWPRYCTENSGPNPSSSTWLLKRGGGDVKKLLTKRGPHNKMIYTRKHAKTTGPPQQIYPMSSWCLTFRVFFGFAFGKVLCNPNWH